MAHRSMWSSPAPSLSHLLLCPLTLSSTWLHWTPYCFSGKPSTPLPWSPCSCYSFRLGFSLPPHCPYLAHSFLRESFADTLHLTKLRPTFADIATQILPIPLTWLYFSPYICHQITHESYLCCLLSVSPTGNEASGGQHPCPLLRIQHCVGRLAGLC